MKASRILDGLNAKKEMDLTNVIHRKLLMDILD